MERVPFIVFQGVNELKLGHSCIRTYNWIQLRYTVAVVLGRKFGEKTQWAILMALLYRGGGVSQGGHKEPPSQLITLKKSQIFQVKN